MSVQKRSIPVVIVGGGQAGLCASYYLTKSKIEHVVLERSQRFHSWKNDRWDSFCLVTPNWQCRMPDWHYNGDDPNGYMVKDEIVNYLEDFANSFKPPIHEGASVEKVDRDKDGKFFVKSSESDWIADSVILATGSYDLQTKPEFAQNLNPDVVQISSKSYKRPSDIPDGVCLVVGTGQSGVQMMEDLWIAGREVRLCVGTAPRSPRIYRGRDATDWLFEIGEYSKTIGEQPNPKLTESKTNHYLSGRDGGHEIDLREFWNGILRNKKWLFLTTGIVFLGSIIITTHSRIFKPVFQGSFSLLIMDPMKSNNQDRNIYDASTDLFQVIANKSDDYEINTLITLLKSPIFVEPVAKEFNLSANSLKNKINIDQSSQGSSKAKGILNVYLNYGNKKSVKKF